MGLDETGSCSTGEIVLDTDGDESLPAKNDSHSSLVEHDSVEARDTNNRFSGAEVDELFRPEHNSHVEAQSDELTEVNNICDEFHSEIEIAESERVSKSQLESQPLPFVARRIGRIDLPENESQIFAFAQARWPAMDMGRKLGASYPHNAGSHEFSASQGRTRGEHTRSAKITSTVRDSVENAQVQPTNRSSHEQEAKLKNPMVILADTANCHNLGVSVCHSPRLSSTMLEAEQSGTNTSSDGNNRKPRDILPLYPGCVQTPLTQNQEQLNHERSSNHYESAGTVQSCQPRGISDSQQAVKSSLPQSITSHSTPYNPSKVAKSRRKPKMPKSSYVPTTQTQPLLSDSTPTEEDLLTILLFRKQQEKKARDMTRAIQQTKDIEFEKVREAHAVLKTQVEELSHRDKAQRAELSRYEKAISGWKIKVRKLEDYLRGLTNDHHKLRDDASDIRRQQESLQIDRNSIQTTLRTHQSLSETTFNAKNMLAEARYHVDKLEQKVQTQSAQAEENAALLQAEQEHCHHLEVEVSKISTSQNHILELFHTQGQELTKQLNDVFVKYQDTGQTSQDNDVIRSMLDRCLALLEHVKDSESVKPGDVEQLDQSFRQYAEQLGTGIQQSVQATNSVRVSYRDFKAQVQRQLDGLRASFETERSLQEQVVDLREIKATMKERLQCSETALAETRQIVLALRNKEDILGQQLSALKAEVVTLQAPSVEDPALNGLIQACESRNSELESKLLTIRQQAAEQFEQLRSSNEERAGLQVHVDGLTAELMAASAKVVTIGKQRDECQNQADTKYENLRAQLLSATNAERKLLADEQSSGIQKIQRQKVAADERARMFEREVDVLKGWKYQESQESARLHSEVEALQCQLQTNNRQADDVREQLRLKEEELSRSLAENQLLKADETTGKQSFAETEVRLKQAITDAASKDQERMEQIRLACDSLDIHVERPSSLDGALGALFESLRAVKQRAQSSLPLKEVSAEPSSSAGVNTQNSDHGDLVQELGSASNRNTFKQPSQPVSGRKSQGKGNIPLSCSGNPQDKSSNIESKQSLLSNGQFRRGLKTGSIIEESQVEKVTYTRNRVTTRSNPGSSSVSKVLLTTPSRRSEDRIGSFAQFDQMNDQPVLTSPPLDPQDFFPPTPVPIKPMNVGYHGRVRSNPRVQSSQSRPTTSKENTIGPAELAHQDGNTDASSFTAAPPGIVESIRPKKRTAADFNVTPGQFMSKRMKTAIERQGLGPVFPEPQSPSAGRNVQANSKARKSRRRPSDDKFVRRFQGRE